MGVRTGFDMTVLWCAHLLRVEVEMIGEESGDVLWRDTAIVGDCRGQVYGGTCEVCRQSLVLCDSSF